MECFQNSARSALYRLEQLIQEAVVTVPRHLIAEAIDLIIFIEGRGTARRIGTVAAIEGLDASGEYSLRACELDPIPPSQETDV